MQVDIITIIIPLMTCLRTLCLKLILVVVLEVGFTYHVEIDVDFTLF